MYSVRVKVNKNTIVKKKKKIHKKRTSEFLSTQVIIILIMVVAKISHGIYTDTYKITESALKRVTNRFVI